MGFLQYVVSRDDVRHICLWFYYYLIDPGHPVTFGVYAGDPVPVRKVKLTSSVSLIKNTGPGRSTQRELLTFRAGGIICIRGSSLRFHTFNCVAPVSWWAARTRFAVYVKTICYIRNDWCSVRGPGAISTAGIVKFIFIFINFLVDFFKTHLIFMG